MHIVTDHIWPDEGCHGLMEGRRLRSFPDGSASWRWIQQLFVVRGDNIAKYETDFGPAEDFPDATETIYPSFGENSVAQLQDLAERDRYSDKWAKRRRELKAESTLHQDIVRQMEQRHEFVHNRSAFGPLVTVQRNEPVSYQGTVRTFKEKRDAYHRTRRPASP